MRCPRCAYVDSKVVETRDTTDGTIRRRRQCLECNHRFTTLETLVKDALVVIKRNGVREEFQPAKIFAGVHKAIEKCGLDDSVVQSTVQGVIDAIVRSYDTEIHSSEIGERVLEAVKELNPVAYVRFASVCKAFKNLSDFDNTLKSFRKDTDGA